MTLETQISKVESTEHEQLKTSLKKDKKEDIKHHSFFQHDGVFRLIFIIIFAGVLCGQILNIGKNIFESHFTSTRVSFLPSSIEEAIQLGQLLHYHALRSPLKVFLFFISLYLWKQAFGVPGSTLLNLLAGSLYGSLYGLVLVLTLTTTGSCICYFISYHFLGMILTHSRLQKRLEAFKEAIKNNEQNLFYYLLFLRLFPFTPNWFINLSAPWLNIPISYFALSIGIGSLPYCFISVQAGELLGEIHSVSDFFTWMTALKLVLVACLALIPTLYKEKLKSKFH